MATHNTALLNYQQIGNGEHVVLIHGLFGTLENLNMVAKSLSNNYCVTSLDVRNHGNSFHLDGMDYKDLAQDIITLLDHLSIKSCFLLGHSMGGKIAMQIALTHPKRVKKLIVADIAPVDYTPNHLKIIEGLNSIDITKITKRKDADKQLAKYEENIGVRQFLLRNIVITDEGKFKFKCNLSNIENGYPQIIQAVNNQDTNPFIEETIFIKGGNSDYILPEHHNIIKSLFPNARAKIVQGAGHWLHAEKTIIFNKIVTNFLSS